MKARRIALKEEFVQIMGNYRDALRLQQFLYWSERTRDQVDFLEEEMAGSGQTAGWFYKSAREFAEECLMEGGRTAALEFFHRLVSMGLADQRPSTVARRNEFEYRLRLRKLISLVNALGFEFESTLRDSSDRHLVFILPENQPQNLSEGRRHNDRKPADRPETGQDRPETGQEDQRPTGKRSTLTGNRQTFTETTQRLPGQKEPERELVRHYDPPPEIQKALVEFHLRTGLMVPGSASLTAAHIADKQFAGDYGLVARAIRNYADYKPTEPQFRHNLLRMLMDPAKVSKWAGPEPTKPPEQPTLDASSGKAAEEFFGL